MCNILHIHISHFFMLYYGDMLLGSHVPAWNVSDQHHGNVAMEPFRLPSDDDDCGFGTWRQRRPTVATEARWPMTSKRISNKSFQAWYQSCQRKNKKSCSRAASTVRKRRGEKKLFVAYARNEKSTIRPEVRPRTWLRNSCILRVETGLIG